MADEQTFEWEGREHEHQEKGPDWFWALGIIAVAAAAAAVIFENVLFAALILVGGFTMALFAAKRPELHAFRVDKRGVAIDKRLYPYQTLQSFWVEYRDGEAPQLIVRANQGLFSHLVIPIAESIDAEELRDYLDDRLEEEELHEPLSQRVFELVGF